MERHLKINDAEFEELFLAGSFDPEVFTHEAHLRLAWIHIRKYGRDQAIINICSQLQRYVNLLGASGKFNKTLTIAAIKAVYHFMLKSNAETFQNFIEEFPRLKNNFRALMACHYGVDIYHSAFAKQEFLEPDLLPFD